MATLSPEQAALLKKTYATADEFKASDNFKKMTTGAQNIALWAYNTSPVTQKPVNTTTPVTQKSVNTDPMELQRQLDANNWASGTNNQSTVTTPVKTQTTTNTPSVSTPEITPKITKTAKDGKPSYTDTGEERMSDIQTNLTRYAETNPEVFLDVAKYRSFFDYNQRVPAQQKALDDFFAIQKDKIAKQEANTLRLTHLWTLSDQALMDITDLNDINLINQDPNLQAKYQQAQKNKQMLEFVYGKKEDVAPRIDWLDWLPDNISSEITQASVDYAAWQKELQALQTNMQNTYDDLVKQAEWTGETDQYIRAKANKINASLQKEYNNKAIQVADKLAKFSALNAEAEMYKQEEATKKADITQRMQMFQMMYWDYSDRNTAKTEIDIQTKDFGTTKNPDRRQSLDGGKTRKKIDWVTGSLSGWGWTSWWTGSWTSWWTSWWTGSWIISSTDLLNDPNLSKSVGIKSYLWEVRWTPQFAFAKKVDNYINNLVLPKIKYLKGATSDKDIAFIRSAATSLDVGMDEKTFKQTLRDMWAVLAKYDDNWNPIKVSSQIPWSNNMSTQINSTRLMVWNPIYSRLK